MFIPDPGSDFFHPGSELSPSRILIKEFKYFNPQKSKKRFLSSKKYDPGCSSWIPDPDADFLPSRIPDPGVKKAPNPGSGSATLTFLGLKYLNYLRIRDPGWRQFGSGNPGWKKGCSTLTVLIQYLTIVSLDLDPHRDKKFDSEQTSETSVDPQHGNI